MSPRLVAPVVVGRAAELGAIDAAFARAAAEEPAVVLLAGEAGIGKTRLAAEGAARAEASGALVLRGSCVQLGRDGLPFAPVVDALRTLVRDTPADELGALLGPSRADIARLLPEAGPPGSADAAEPGTASRLFEALLGLFGRLAATRPLVLVIEDVHWADRATLDLLEFLVRSLRHERVLSIVTYRSDELHRGHPLRVLLAELDRLRNVERLELGRFDRERVSEQLAAILGERPADALVDRVFERSEGNAFLVEEVLDLVRGGEEDALPRSLRNVLLARTDRLSDPARQVLQVTAVGGRRVPHALLSEVAGLSDAELYAALREAVEHQVLEIDGDAYAFRHTMLRDAISDDMLPGEGARLHGAYAAALGAHRDVRGDGAAPAGELAHHLYAAHDLAGALPVMLEAARQAAAAYAHAEAQQHLERALEVWPRVPDAEARTGVDHVQLLQRTIRAATDAGNEDRAVLLTDQALAEVDREREPARTALLLEHKASLLRDLGRSDGSAELEAAVALLGDEPTPELAIVLASFAVAQINYSNFERAGELARRAAAAANAAGARRVEASARISLGMSLGYTGRIEEGLVSLRDALELARDAGDSDSALRAQINLSDLYAAAGRHEAAVEVAAEGIALARQVGLARSRGAFLMGNQAESLFRLGRWDEAVRVIEAAVAIDTMGVHAGMLGLAYTDILIAQGRYADADEQARLTARQVDAASLQYGVPLTTQRAATAHGLGDLERAASLVSRGLERWDVRTNPRYGWPLLWIGMRTSADLAERARDRREPAPPPDAAAALAALARELAVTHAEEHGYRAVVDAEAARATGEPAAHRWEAAVAAWRSAGDPYPLAYALLRLAEAHVAQGDRREARPALEEAARVAGRLGAHPLEAAAGALARRARLTVGDANGTPADAADQPGRTTERLGLTARELDVLRLLAAGRSNPQIAAELFISPKTASVHVSNILAKLRVSTRVEAAGIAHRLGLVDADGATVRP